jgi:hypothetical protein
MKPILKHSDSSVLYERDFNLWVEQQVAHLEAHSFSILDLEHLILEIKDLAQRYRDELESRLDTLLQHLLKRQYIPVPDDYNGWERTIREQQGRILRLFRRSPSLKPYFAEVLPEIWQDARNRVARDYPRIAFPEDNPFTQDAEMLLAIDFPSVE